MIFMISCNLINSSKLLSLYWNYSLVLVTNDESYSCTWALSTSFSTILANVKTFNNLIYGWLLVWFLLYAKMGALSILPPSVQFNTVLIPAWPQWEFLLVLDSAIEDIGPLSTSYNSKKYY